MADANGHDTSELRERPIGEVARELTRDLSLLVRQEVELAKAEMAQKGRVAAPGLGMIGAAGVAGLMAAGALTACAVLVLAIFLPRLARGADRRRRPGRGCLRAWSMRGKERVEAGGQRRSRTDHRDGEGGRGMGQDPSDIRAEIEETRVRVGDEVDALSYKTDVPARVGDYVDDKKQAVAGKVTDVKDAVAGATVDGASRAARRSAG